jgi:hypothetical protein
MSNPFLRLRIGSGPSAVRDELQGRPHAVPTDSVSGYPTPGGIVFEIGVVLAVTLAIAFAVSAVLGLYGIN